MFSEPLYHLQFSDTGFFSACLRLVFWVRTTFHSTLFPLGPWGLLSSSLLFQNPWILYVLSQHCLPPNLIILIIISSFCGRFPYHLSLHHLVFIPSDYVHFFGEILLGGGNITYLLVVMRASKYIWYMVKGVSPVGLGYKPRRLDGRLKCLSCGFFSIAVEQIYNFMQTDLTLALIPQFPIDWSIQEIIIHDISIAETQHWHVKLQFVLPT